jgi:hypothetical protein
MSYSRAAVAKILYHKAALKRRTADGLKIFFAGNKPTFTYGCSAPHAQLEVGLVTA